MYFVFKILILFYLCTIKLLLSVYLAFMDLGKAYYRVDRNAVWQMLQMYAGEGMLGGAVKGV